MENKPALEKVHFISFFKASFIIKTNPKKKIYQQPTDESMLEEKEQFQN